MMHRIERGTRVCVRATILEAGERAPGVPTDTASVPYEVRMFGELIEPCQVGEVGEIITATGRRAQGRVEQVGPVGDVQPAAAPVALERTRSAIDQLRDSFCHPS